jgi:site-specific DNA-methyltransferase (adenine-specific)
MELINGDCLEVMKDLSDNSVDFLFCDLPYGQTSCKWDCLIDLDLFWKQVNRVCKQDAVMAFTCSVKFGNTLINSNPKCFRYDLVWVKSAACGFLNAKKMPMKKHEMVYIFYRKLPKVYTENIALHHTHKFLKATPNSVIKEENVVVETRDTTNYKNESDLYGNIERPDFKRKNNESMYNPPLPNTILEIKSEKGKHATQKPVPLMEYLIKYFTREGETVLDPTMGSGGTGIACKNLNRKFIGIEMDKDIFDVGVERNK